MKRTLPLLLATVAALGLGQQSGFAQTNDAGTPKARLGGEAFQTPNASGTGSTAESQAPNTDYKPLLPNQTRAPQPPQKTEVEVASVAKGLASAWALEFLPDGRMIVTEKAGKIRIISKEGAIGDAVAGVPKVDSRGQGGLLDIALSPSFAADRLVYISYSEPREKGNGTTVAKAKLIESGGTAKLDDLKVIFRQTPTYDGDKHFGSRLVFSTDGKLFVTVGERSDKQTRGQAQDLTSGLGKVFRIDTDGNAPKDNPFAGSEKAKPEIWSYGHRNVQGATLDGQGRLWIVEHGPRGGDELNRPRPGINYGWPIATYGLEYSGDKIADGATMAAGTSQPVYYWDPVIGPSAIAYYDKDMFPAWKGQFIVGGLVSEGLVVLKLAGDTVVTEERVPLDRRIRDVKVGADGAIYAVTEGENGEILKLTSKKGS
ncbi:PQQ-dependent sugar dehydrogenase [Methylobacterium gnaphalii]|uniref:Glucose dehydrogenase n=1 Tax=Methylobacterium gnaphalii TaxID=1010610 RepID=A0A512JGM0_9HYPH|nr:PQQ-dependent sugar dehydrogenase [Methylobacterium gnaphalii]GEP09108.1 glucose dehydrogenase [Methylobacterium gnaphalii]GJD68421.1 Aldose sugar dehydrogenase YliI [Methylobacterium gnaphalii]GLS49032.1 glucose dehydrogenase [Methylobacterium gnaphalii]